MKKCKLCGNNIPKSVVIEGKKRNLQTRKFCFDCSPFGKHNTRSFTSGTSGNLKECPDCGLQHTQKGKRCFACYFNKRQVEIVERVKQIVGDSCWLCGYNKTWRSLAFHHVDPKTKSFGLSTRELVGTKWPLVEQEIRKCILCCHNCHCEIHEGLISSIQVDEAIRNHPFNSWEKPSKVTGECATCKCPVFKKKYCCLKCARMARRKVERPNREKLEQMLQAHSYKEVGRQLGVSDNAIRKWLK